MKREGAKMYHHPNFVERKSLCQQFVTTEFSSSKVRLKLYWSYVGALCVNYLYFRTSFIKGSRIFCLSEIVANRTIIEVFDDYKHWRHLSKFKIPKIYHCLNFKMSFYLNLKALCRSLNAIVFRHFSSKAP